MKVITKSVIRKLLRMKLRIVGILLVIAFASAMLLSGLYGAGAMDASVEYYVKEGVACAVGKVRCARIACPAKWPLRYAPLLVTAKYRTHCLKLSNIIWCGFA